MDQLQKHKKLIELIKEESDFADEDFFDPAIVLEVKDLDRLGFTDLELDKSLKRLIKDKVIINYDLVKEENRLDLDGSNPDFIARVYVYIKSTHNSKISFNEVNGELSYNGKVVKFTLNKNPYIFVKLLYSKTNEIFPYIEIIKHFKNHNIDINKDSLRQFSRQVRNAFKDKGIPESVMYCNEGYALMG